jgi:hypothetical protein
MEYLKSVCLKNKLAALYESMCAEELGPNFQERFLICQYARKIEAKLIKRESQDRFAVEIDNLIRFQKNFAQMQEVLKGFIGFWKDLREETSNFFNTCKT